jgi:hypothetical protein
MNMEIAGDCGATIEVALNDRGVVLVRHSQFQPKAWAEPQEYSATDLGGIPKSGGYVIIEGRTFDLSREEMAAIGDAAKRQASKLKSAKRTPKTDPHATNKLLSAYLTMQNQFSDWAELVRHTAEYYDAALTPSQRESVRLALVCSTRASKRLQLLQKGLTK